jgi:undecaprenyl-diphosphatase
MMTESVKIVLLAIVQGITEFLPISSSGHLVVLEAALDIKGNGIFLNLILHAGTLVAILAYYARDLKDLIKPQQRRQLWLIAVATLPLVFPGLLIRPLIKSLYTELWFTGCGLLATAAILLLVHRPRPETEIVEKSESGGGEKLPWKTAIYIGLMQCLALVPGISRSGATIAIATRLGVSAETAARFTFMLAIPAIIGAQVIEGISQLRAPEPFAMTYPVGGLVAGFIVSIVVGYLSLSCLLHILQRGKLSWFGWYCLAAGIATLIIDLTTA